MSFQKTIKEEVTFEGKGLQTGRKVRVKCKPASADSGVVFKRLDLEYSPEIRLRDAVFSENRERRRTTIGLGKVQVQTVEHFLASLWALEVDNLLVEVDGEELPALDGSAIEFFTSLKEAGTTEEDSPRKVIKIEEGIHLKDGERAISVLPKEGFSVSYLIDYNVGCIEKKTFEIELNEESFRREIAPARTFCLKREALLLFLSGMGRGANFRNTLILGNKGPVGTKFRFPDEPVRHKVLDLIGDLYLLGMPLEGRIVAEKSGHKLNSELAKRIYEKYVK